MNPQEIGKLLGRDFLVATFFILSVAGVGAIGNIMGLKGITTDVGALGNAISTFNLVALAWIFFMLMAVGALALFWARASKLIGHYLKIKNADNPTEGTGKLKIISVFFYGVLVTIFISALNLFLQGLNSNLNVTSIKSLQQAFMSGNIALIVGMILAVGGLGVAVIRLRRLYPYIEKGLPKPLDH